MLQVNKFYYYSFIHFVSRVVQKYMFFCFIFSPAMKYYILLYLTMMDIKQWIFRYPMEPMRKSIAFYSTS